MKTVKMVKHSRCMREIIEGNHGYNELDIEEWVPLTEAEAEIAAMREQIENPKMTYCAFCGEQYDIEDREKAIELITEHVQVCPKHPIAALRERQRVLVEIYKSGTIVSLTHPSTYAYKVIGRHGTPIHHTESLKDAQDYLNKCRDKWASSALAAKEG